MNAKKVTPEDNEPTNPATVPTADSAESANPDTTTTDAAESAAESAAGKPAEQAATPASDANTPVADTAAGVGEAEGTDTASATDASTDASTDSAATGEAPTAASPVQTVYVTAPNPPKSKGNRGIGILLAIVATIVFALVYAGLAALLILLVGPAGIAGAIGLFVTGPLFYVPVLAFLVIMVLWALLVNRASWWAWVLGSLVIGAVVYFASIGVLLLLAGGFGLTAAGAAETFRRLAFNPALVIAALLARETAVWLGAAISARGRRVRQRNYDAWQEFERTEAQKRAEFGGQAA